MRMKFEQRLAYLREKNGEDGCWTWHSPGSHGYCSTKTLGGEKNRKTVSAHRRSWIHFNGPIPINLVIDHKCKNRACVNPAHLRVVTQKENLLGTNHHSAKTHCIYGHPLDGTNISLKKSSRTGQMMRNCLTCARERVKKWRLNNPEMRQAQRAREKIKRYANKGESEALFRQ